jgi:hypothetical protein
LQPTIEKSLWIWEQFPLFPPIDKA